MMSREYTEAELRMQALDYAVRAKTDGTSLTQILAAAQEFYDFLRASDS